MIRSVLVSALALAAGSAMAQPASSQTEHAAALAAIREYALNYTRNLPDYTCDQVISRVMNAGTSARDGTPIVGGDKIEEQLSFVDKREIRKIVRINGNPAPAGDQNAIKGALSQGEFGNLLDVIFEPATSAELRWDRTARLNGRPMNVLAFSVPKANGYDIVGPKVAVRVPFKGFVYADAQTNAVMRIEMKCFDIPADSEYQELDLTLDYKATQIAGQSFLLPSHYTLLFRSFHGNGTNQADYTSYRKFAANASVSFNTDN